MSTHWQEPQGMAPPPASKPPASRKKFAFVGVLLVVIAGLAASAGLVLVNRDSDNVADDAQYVVMDSNTVEPVFEPRDAAGNDPFFPLDTQLVTYRQEVEAEIEEQVRDQVAEAEANGETDATIEVPTFNVDALDAAVKTGLYGGTDQNTCDPERLISFLIANPEIGEAWATVQGIPFSQIPSYIRSLDVRVLAEPVNVLNHGYDPVTESAYEIDTVLDAGTAVLVDADGNIRTRCYCGNPIKPKPPTGHMPPRCIVWGASVFIVPGGANRRDDAPRDVFLTGQETTLGGGAVWVEVIWGNGDDDRGWVEIGNLRTHYCPPPSTDWKCPGPERTNVYANDRTTVVGQVSGTVPTSGGDEQLFGLIDPAGAPGDETIVDGFLLIHFTQAFPSVNNNGWVNLSDLNNDDCGYIDQCIDLDNTVRARAGGADLDAALTGRMNIRYTGHFAPDHGLWAEVRILDGTGRVGWIPKLFATPLVDDECVDKWNDCIRQAEVYKTSDGAATIAEINNGKVRYDAPPVIENGRVRVHLAPVGGPTGWVDMTDLAPGFSGCTERVCMSFNASAWTVFETDGDELGAMPTPAFHERLGIRVTDPASFQRIGVAAVGYWINEANLTTHDPLVCEPDDPSTECPDFQGIAIDQLSPLTFVTRTGDDFPEDRIPEDDDGRVERCCVTALFISPDVTDPAPAAETPAWVTVFNEIEVLGDPWYVTTGGRYFLEIHVDDIGAACLEPECPETDQPPSRDDMNEVLGGVSSDVFVGSFAVVQADGGTGYPEPGDGPGDDRPDPQEGDACCVDELWSDLGIGQYILDGPQLVTVVDGPFDGPGDTVWFETADGDYFPSGAITNVEDCRQVECPDGSDDDSVTEILEPKDGEFAVSMLLTIDVDLCCVEGEIFDAPNGAEIGSVDAIQLVLIDSNADGTWHHLLLDGAIPGHVSGWAESSSIAFADCDTGDVDPDCPKYSVIDFNSNGHTACCAEIDGDFVRVLLTGTARPSEIEADGIDFETFEHGWIHESAFVGAGRCDDGSQRCPKESILGVSEAGNEICCIELDAGVFGPYEITEGLLADFADAERCEARCPTFSVINAAVPDECCVNLNGEFTIVTLTGETSVIGAGVQTYETEENGTVFDTDFAAAGECAPCPNGVEIQGVCCAKGQELFRGQCVDPCPRGQERDVNGNCFTPDSQPIPDPQPEPDPEPQPEPDPCPNGEIVQGLCCAKGQIVSNNQCADPCIFQGGDRDGDGICDQQDTCPTDPSDTCQEPCPDSRDSDGDGICDPQDNCPQDPTNDCTTTDPDPCPGTVDSDGDGLCDPQDDCPQDPTNTCYDPCAAYNDIDSDGDGWCDQQDPCPTDPNLDCTSGQGQATPCSDQDKDGFCDDVDLCPLVPTQVNEYPYGTGCFNLTVGPGTVYIPPAGGGTVVGPNG